MKMKVFWLALIIILYLQTMYVVTLTNYNFCLYTLCCGLHIFGLYIYISMLIHCLLAVVLFVFCLPSR